MKRCLFIGVAALAAVLLFIGCGPPPPGAEFVDALDYTYKTMLELNRYSGDIKGFREYFKENREADRVFAFMKGSHIEIVSGSAPVYPDVILRSLPNNDLILEKGLYVTEGRRNEALVSLNGKDWYSTRTDFDRGTDNFKNEYFYELDYKPDNRTLYINYVLSSGFNATRKKRFVGRGRNTETIKKGMIFKHPDKRLVNYDLMRRVLYIPAGTVISTDFKFAGNLMTSGKKQGVINVDVLQDVYLFYKRLRVGISFDGEDWNTSIFSFKISPLLQVYADADDHIKVLFGLSVNYKK